ncbi:MAG TPA: D-alanine--D-alanine ligase [Candidatus Kapabacteria bacterium]|nr:D-alanine--D-alanine ligase [Candidatus Kapabacteria bacterium]
MNVVLTFNLKPASVSSPLSSPALTISSDNTTNGTSAAAEHAHDMFAEWDEIETVRAITSALEKAGHIVIEIEANERFPQELLRARPDIVFNIAEGIGARSREAQIPAICEMYNIPHTGSDAVTLGICLDKSHTKEILSYYGIPTAKFLLAHSVNDANKLPFPLPVFIKPVHEGSSKGIFSTSLCRTTDGVRKEVERITSTYNQPALIEEYLPGREFTVAMLGNGDSAQVLPIIEYNFSSLPGDVPKIDSFEAKWIYDRPDDPLDSLHCPADIPEQLRKQIETMCLRAYRALRILDWARIDVRLDANNMPHIIEINPLPGILPRPEDNSCFPKAARTAGYSYDQLMQTVLRLAAERYGLARTSRN